MADNVPALGVSQIREVDTKQVITIGSEEWRLKRDASDPSTNFAHERVNWIEQGCYKVQNQPFYACWIKGVILAAPGSLEKSQYVMYVGFHSKQINMSPAFLTLDDLKCMHIYGRNEPHFAETFVNSFLGVELVEQATREPISSQPPKQTRKKTEEVEDGKAVTE